MKEVTDTLKNLGFDSWSQDNADTVKLTEFEPARVIAVHKDSFVVTNGEYDVFAELVGKFTYSTESPIDFPTVGDWVYAQFYNENTSAIIHEILPRKSLLKRKTPGKTVDIQLIAANIDTAFIVQSLDANFNLRRLERYLVMISDGGIRPVVLLSKSDLLSPEDIESRIADIKGIMPHLPVYPFSNENKMGFADVQNVLVSGQTYCLVGSSGVGKTTLLNNLIGELLFETQAVREKDSRGRHTTSHRQLIWLKSGAMIIDTPGIRELGMFSVESGLNEAFSEIAELSEECQFSDCSHIHEKGCAVLKAVEDNTLPRARYHNYIKMGKESDYNEMSYLEKRQKDRQFGKMIKSVIKHKKNKR